MRETMRGVSSSIGVKFAPEKCEISYLECYSPPLLTVQIPQSCD